MTLDPLTSVLKPTASIVSAGLQRQDTYRSLPSVGQAYDIAATEPGRSATTLGRHTNDYMTSSQFYARTPNAFMVEYGWGAGVPSILRPGSRSR